jgi:undecaprenyl-diphosphatase
MEKWLLEILDWLPDDWRYASLLGLIALAESLPAVGLLVPGSTLIFFAGVLALHGKGSIATVIAASTVGAICGDLISYGIGARAGSTLLHSRVMRRRLDLVRKAELFFVAHGGKSVLFSRFAGPIRGLVPFIAGCARMRPGPFFIYALGSGLLWGLGYPGLGYLAGASWQRVQLWGGRFGMMIAVVLAATALLVWWRRWKRATAQDGKPLHPSGNSPKIPPSVDE